jgi:hypothetical protein
MMPQQFPCGPDSACCGPIGQTEEEVQNLKNVLEKELACHAEVLNVTKGADMKDHLPIVRLFRSFGPMALPIIALDGEVVSMGIPTPGEAVLAVKEKMNQI